MQFIDLRRQYSLIKDKVDSAVVNVMNHGKYIMGPEVRQFECDLAAFVGSRHAIGCSNGTEALTMALMALGIGRGDAVFTTPFTFFATTETIAREGATPVYCDIDPGTYSMDAEKLESAIEKTLAEGRLVPRAICPVDLFGLAADYRRIVPIARKYNLAIIEDAAQALGAVQDGRRAPTFGTIGCTSFFPAKPLGCYGDGGAVFTDDDSLAERLRSIVVHGKGADKYDNVRLGLNGRLDTMQAAILIEKLKIFPNEIEERQRVAKAYMRELDGIVKLPRIPDGNVSVWAQFCVQHPKRDAIMAALKDRGIPCNVYYPKPMHLLGAMAYLGLGPGSFPCAEEVSRQVFALPMHPYLSEDDVAEVSSAVREALAQTAA